MSIKSINSERISLRLFNQFWTIFLLLFTQLCFSQGSIVKGRVINGESDEPIEGVICKVYDSTDEMITYALSTKSGEVLIKSDETPAYIIFSYLGFQNERVEYISFIKSKEVKLFSKAIEIEEIVIKSQAITQEGDTLNYSVTPFKGKEDRYLKDVLKKLPGITVNTTGAITYQGKPINKFYMEGLDLLGNQYTIASNNLPIDAVQSVQVIENNQHIKTLKGVEFSENAALNIKFKDEYKQKPFGEVKTAFGGSPLLSSNKVFATLIAKNSQTLVTAKSDNTGVNIEVDTREQIDFTDLFSFDMPLKQYIGNTSIRRIPMDEKRYLFNETYLGSINHLKKLAKEATLRFKVDITKDHKQQDSYYISNYDLMNGEVLTLNEDRNVALSNTRLNASVNYEKNSTAVYFKNELKTIFNWQRSNESLLQGLDQFTNHVKQDNVTIQNRFAYIFGTDDNKYTIDAFIKYVDQPERMTLNTLKGTDKASSMDRQKVDNKHLLFKAQSGKTMRVWSNPLSFNVELYYNNDELKTRLETDKKYSFLDQYLHDNSVRFKKYGTTLTTSYTYYLKEGNLRINIPLKYEQHSVFDRIGVENEEKGNFLITPSVSFNYNLNQLWKFNANTSYTESVSQIDNYYQGVVMATYRDFMTYGNLPQKYKSMRYEVGLDHRNLLTSVFFNLNIGYQPSKINVANQGYYDKDYTWSNKVAQDIKMDKLYLNTRVSKLFSELKTTLALSTSYEYYKSDIWQQNTLFTNYSNQWTVGFEAFVKKLDWMSIQYIISDNIFWENNQFRNTDKLHNITQQVNLSFFTLKNVQLQLSGEHNYNDMGGKESYKNFFIDATASYKLKQVEFTALLQNLLDKKEYSYTSYTGLNSSSLKIPIRGRSILLGATFSF